MRMFRKRFLAELRSAYSSGFARVGTRGFADVRITGDLFSGRPFTIYETQSTFDVNVIKTISASFVVAGSMVTAMDLSTDRRQEDFGKVETDVSDKNLWQRITPTAKLVNLGAILMLGLFYLLPQRYVTKLSVSRETKMFLELTTWGPFGRGTKVYKYPLFQLATRDSSVLPQVKGLQSFRVRHVRMLYTMDTERGIVYDKALFLAVLTGPAAVAKKLDARFVHAVQHPRQAQPP
ncbi:hypothetical protein NDN08_007825 [Rhodosorus marinus]|uniref:DUF304 domain-containing protein n=1 Tax=Rhodosorus marinus TaxID=101924 RepID=A0AAV8V079_9RHOD|nr:hypothetical protein NDN08_007825 [Rhodosorus marinus]